MNAKKAFYFILLALAVFAADGILKAYIDSNIPPISAAAPIYPYGGIGVFEDWKGIEFSIVHVCNRGAAWGFFSTLQHYLLYARMAIIGGLITHLLFVKTPPLRKLSLMLILAGASGNVLDFFLYGHVVDMFYFIFWGYSYPVFNIADSAIFAGIAMLLLQSLFERVRRAPKVPARG